MAWVRLAALAAAAAFGAGGCGGDDGADERKEIESNVHAYYRAFAAGDTTKVCSLMTTSARNHFLESAGSKNCPSALGEAMADPKLGRFADRLEHARVVKVTLEDADSATAKVAALGVTRDVPVRKEADSWKIEGAPAETAPGS
jgi:hypothetical protein